MKKKEGFVRLRYFIIGLLLVFVMGCQSENKVTPYENSLFYIDLEETKVVSEGYEHVGVTMREQVEEYIAALDYLPKNSLYKCAKPEDIKITDYVIGADGLLTIYFDTEYNRLSGISEVLCRAVIVKTMCQVEGINSVEFYINGQPLMKAAETPVGWMKAEDFIDNTGAETNYNQYTSLCIYYADETGTKLKPVHLRVEYEGIRTQEQLVMEQLLLGPVQGQTEMHATLPPQTKVNKVSTKDGICYVDFNETFLEKTEYITGEITIYSIVNSLVELANVNQVQITVNGELKKTYQGMELTDLLERKLELVEE